MLAHVVFRSITFTDHSFLIEIKNNNVKVKHKFLDITLNNTQFIVVCNKVGLP